MSKTKTTAAILVCLGILASNYGAELLHPRQFAVELTAQVRSSPHEITLAWREDQNAIKYSISRKILNERNWILLGERPGSSSSFLDPSVQIGVPYEYKVIKETSRGYTGYGYIAAGIEIPPVEDRGSLLLLVENSVVSVLKPELLRLEYDLLGDGWKVIRKEVDKDASPRAIKDIILSEFKSASNLNTVFLLGNIAVPYSGNITPDEHENHRGAWPADVYYADLDGVWTDTSVISTNAEKWWNRNVPNDGKFDQDDIPSSVELRVGRVDLSNMTCFLNKTPSRNEIDLLRLYLTKNHKFRHGQFAVEPRALIFDRIGLSTPEPLSSMAWRNFAPFVGSNIQQIKELQFVPSTTTNTYLWSAVTAGGSFIVADMVGSSDIFALNNVNVVFTFFCGSYYGDWDNESNFLRAALGTAGMVLTSAYSAQPQWICHTMALGEPIGQAVKLTQENAPGGFYPPHNHGAGQVHIALMGDPTLRAFPVLPPSALNGTIEGNQMRLSWTAPADPNLRGYLVYKRTDRTEAFSRLTDRPIPDLHFTDPNFVNGNEYAVKAISLTQTPSGTYWNTSQGLFFPDPFQVESSSGVPTSPTSLVVHSASQSEVLLRWVNTSSINLGFELERRERPGGTFAKIEDLAATTTEYKDSSVTPGRTYSYRIRAYNSVGASPFSNEAVASTTSSDGEFVRIDSGTRGNWKGIYGSEGYYVFGTEANLPSTVSLTSSNCTIFNYTYITNSDPRLLSRPLTNNRVATCWVSPSPFILDLNMSDDKARQVALYALDYDYLGRTIEVELFDFTTRQRLSHQKLESISGGVYFVYNAKGRVLFKITPQNVYTNATIFGLFLDPAKTASVNVSPAGGTFTGKTLVTLSSETPGATIYYSIDGSTPGTGSLLYQAPFWLHETTRLRAKAVKPGYLDSGVAEADFLNLVRNRAGLIRWDDQTSGNWIGVYGVEGHSIPSGSSRMPSYANVTFENSETWVWNETTDGPAALYVDSAGASRRASCWYAPESFTVNLNVIDSKSRAVTLYFVDWDNQKREQQIELLGPIGEVIDSYTIRDFNKGKYLVLNVQGELKIRITRLSGKNAVLNGIFYDPAPLELNPLPGPPRLEPAWNGSSFTIKVDAPSGIKICVDGSPDLNTWTCLETYLVVETPFHVFDPSSSTRPAGFYRVHFVP